MSTDDFLKQLLNPLGFDSLEPGLTPEQQEAHSKIAENQWEIAKAFHRTFTSPHGKIVLQHLREMCIESSTWRASLGLLNGIANGFAREGQNALVRYMEDQIKAAVQRGEQLKKEAEDANRTKNEAAGT